MKPSERDNVTLWDGRQRGFYEVYYLKVNHLDSHTALWARYTLLAPRQRSSKPVAELWVVFFDRNDPARNLALKRTFPVTRATIGRHPFLLRIADAELRHGHAVGGLAGDGNVITWELDWEPAAETFAHFPRPSLYQGGFPKTKVLAPNLSVPMRGFFALNGTTYRLDGAPGHQAHLWGTRQGLRWTWGNCNAFAEDPTAVFEALSAQVQVGPLPSPTLTVCALYHQGQWHRFNELGQWLTNRSRSELGQWELRAQGQDVRLVGHISSRFQDLVGVEYTDTDGSHLYCHNAKVGDMVLEIYRRAGGRWSLSDRLTSAGTTAVEWVMRQPDPRVALRI